MAKSGAAEVVTTAMKARPQNEGVQRYVSYALKNLYRSAEGVVRWAKAKHLSNAALQINCYDVLSKIADAAFAIGGSAVGVCARGVTGGETTADERSGHGRRRARSSLHQHPHRGFQCRESWSVCGGLRV